MMMDDLHLFCPLQILIERPLHLLFQHPRLMRRRRRSVELGAAQCIRKRVYAFVHFARELQTDERHLLQRVLQLLSRVLKRVAFPRSTNHCCEIRRLAARFYDFVRVDECIGHKVQCCQKRRIID